MSKDTLETLWNTDYNIFINSWAFLLILQMLYTNIFHSLSPFVPVTWSVCMWSWDNWWDYSCPAVMGSLRTDVNTKSEFTLCLTPFRIFTHTFSYLPLEIYQKLTQSQRQQREHQREHRRSHVCCLAPCCSCVCSDVKAKRAHYTVTTALL